MNTDIASPSALTYSISSHRHIPAERSYTRYLIENDKKRRKKEGSEFTDYPERTLNELFSSRATISTSTILNAISEKVENQKQAEIICRKIDKMVSEGKLIPLTATKHTLPGTEKSADDLRWTTPEMLKLEKDLRFYADSMAKARYPLLPVDVEQVKALGFEPGSKYEHVCERILLGHEKLIPIKGHAGTGKSYVLKRAFELVRKNAPHRNQIGLAQREATALDLQESSKIPSMTTQEFIRGLRSGKVAVNKNTDLVLDEANLVGTREMRDLFEIAHKYGARLILAGDTSQLPPLTAGSPFRMIIDECRKVDAHGIPKVSIPSLDRVRRQSGWQLKAATLARSGKTIGDALVQYVERGHFHAPQTPSEAVKQSVDLWMAKGHLPYSERLLIAHRDEDVTALNDTVHDRRHKRGDFNDAVVLNTPQGKLTIGVKQGPAGQDGDGERVIFRGNLKLKSTDNKTATVLKGMRGTVRGLKNGSIRILLDGADKKEVLFDYKRYEKAKEAAPIGYAYATSSYDAEGQSANHVVWYATPHDFQASAYIALSRSRLECDIVVASDLFPTKEPGHRHLARSVGHAIGREHTHDTASGFALLRHEGDFFSHQLPKVISQISQYHQKIRRRPGQYRFTQWMRGAGGSSVLSDLRACLKKESPSWASFHAVLAQHGILARLNAEGTRLKYIDPTNHAWRCKESLLPSDFHLPALEGKLGPFVPKQIINVRSSPSPEANPWVLNLQTPWQGEELQGKIQRYDPAKHEIHLSINNENRILPLPANSPGLNRGLWGKDFRLHPDGRAEIDLKYKSPSNTPGIASLMKHISSRPVLAR